MKFPLTNTELYQPCNLIQKQTPIRTKQIYFSQIIKINSIYGDGNLIFNSKQAHFINVLQMNMVYLYLTHTLYCDYTH